MIETGRVFWRSVKVIGRGGPTSRIVVHRAYISSCTNIYTIGAVVKLKPIPAAFTIVLRRHPAARELNLLTRRDRVWPPGSRDDPDPGQTRAGSFGPAEHRKATGSIVRSSSAFEWNNELFAVSPITLRLAAPMARSAVSP
ncbi:hypothetical protein EVAR_55134_1 [Eumeta japonica]|uniref:Uncharacterized protein n=1 Tax=Eumeta variegata TaxID=151549 RepID=A0A4C1Y8T2_EUMVA|nr:hypothetical protein EVAR_55134_1 [Eumeta japonica]